MRAMILAAGRGTRMGRLTQSTPKPLLDLNGESLIERHLKRLAAAGVDDVVINLSYLGERIREALGDGERYGVRIRYSQEPARPLETAGGIVKALPLLGDKPFLVVNSDVVSDFDYAALEIGALSGVLVLVPNPAHHPGGDYGVDGASRLTHAEPKYTFAGISLLSPTLFAGLPPGRRPLTEVFDAGIAARSVGAVVHSGLWIDVGTPERLEHTRSVVRAGA
ncbi:MAG TPA: nucleotidyltransferase family protein [Gammaproteobacteria bacterium]|nr:nucleotidyltransferase family protein [Gammaproteobacteria bacterium]